MRSARRRHQRERTVREGCVREHVNGSRCASQKECAGRDAVVVVGSAAGVGGGSRGRRRMKEEAWLCLLQDCR